MPGTYTIPQLSDSLGRHVHHDPLSRRFPYTRGAAESYRPPGVLHARHIPIFDQGDLGKCTAETGLGLMGTSPYWDALCAIGGSDPVTAGPYPLTDQGTTALYETITANDPFDGQYPPVDTGSDGLSMAKTLTAAGIIPGYQHTFTIGDALRALADYPLAVGTLWTDRMFNPNRAGLIRYDGSAYAIGGHEWIADQYVPERDWVGGTTSWGTSFGVNGRFYLTVADFAALLADDGDVIVLTPSTGRPPHPEPDPLPVPDPPVPGAYPTTPEDADLARAMRAWLTARGL